jgi:hypothetical protein
MTSYSSSVLALQKLLQQQQQQRCESHSGLVCHITKMSRTVAYLQNGIEYCHVEVTCEDGEQYGIQAFGQEAVELHNEALKLSQSPRKEERKEETMALVL